MYRHCPACTRDLGTNDSLEHFPVGRRLAFDEERGRLWALCPRCRSWNLAPIESRWEAVEEAARAFEGAPQGVATEHIALGRLGDGTELVRIGRAPAPELAGWRYAQRIDRRWRRTRWTGSGSVVGWFGWSSGLLSAAGPLLPILVAGLAGQALWRWVEQGRNQLHVPLPDLPGPGSPGGEGAYRSLRSGQLARLRLLPPPPGEPDDAWNLELRSFGYRPLLIPPELRNRALRMVLPELNREVGKPRHVQAALARVVEAGDPDRVAGAAARTLEEGRAWEVNLGWPWGDPLALRGADPVMRLALEIAANDESERLALEGELHRLRLEWQEAEELAAISDDLLLPPWIRARIREWRDGSPSPIAPPPDFVDPEKDRGRNSPARSSPGAAAPGGTLPAAAPGTGRGTDAGPDPRPVPAPLPAPLPTLTPPSHHDHPRIRGPEGPEPSSPGGGEEPPRAGGPGRRHSPRRGK